MNNMIVFIATKTSNPAVMWHSCTAASVCVGRVKHITQAEFWQLKHLNNGQVEDRGHGRIILIWILG
jgi:hypothetical protein